MLGDPTEILTLVFALFGAAVLKLLSKIPLPVRTLYYVFLLWALVLLTKGLYVTILATGGWRLSNDTIPNAGLAAILCGYVLVQLVQCLYENYESATRLAEKVRKRLRRWKPIRRWLPPR